MELERLKFLQKVNKKSGRVVKDLSECWFWKGAPDKRDGYCRFQTDWAKRTGCIYAHQAAYKLFRDENYTPSRTNPCSHRCESNEYEHRICVNPEHLYIAASIAENMADRDENRGNYQAEKTAGVKNGNAKFTEEQKAEIFKKREEGMLYKEIAEEYGVNRRTIERLCLGRTYKT